MARATPIAVHTPIDPGDMPALDGQTFEVMPAAAAAPAITSAEAVPQFLQTFKRGLDALQKQRLLMREVIEQDSQGRFFGTARAHRAKYNADQDYQRKLAELADIFFDATIGMMAADAALPRVLVEANATGIAARATGAVEDAEYTRLRKRLEAEIIFAAEYSDAQQAHRRTLELNRQRLDQKLALKKLKIEAQMAEQRAKDDQEWKLKLMDVGTELRGLLSQLDTMYGGTADVYVAGQIKRIRTFATELDGILKSTNPAASAQWGPQLIPKAMQMVIDASTLVNRQGRGEQPKRPEPKEQSHA